MAAAPEVEIAWNFGPEVQVTIVAGAPRAGKDTTAAEYGKQYGAPILSVDEAIRLPLWRDAALLSQATRDHEARLQTDLTTLFRKNFDDGRYTQDDEWIEHVLGRDDGHYFINSTQVELPRVFWNRGKMAARIGEELAASASDEVLVQGSTVTPELVTKLPGALNISPAQVRAIYLGNENPNHDYVILRKVHEAIASGDLASNWMAKMGYSDRKVLAYMAMCRAVSKMRREQAQEFGFPYVDMGDGNFLQNVQRVVGYLASGVLT